MSIARPLLALGTFGLLIALSPSADADCMEKCTARVGKCEKLAQASHQKCVQRAEKVKAAYVARTAKSKYAAKYRERAQQAFDRRKASCDKRKAGNDRWCGTVKGRCERKCGKTLAKPAATAKPAAAKGTPIARRKIVAAGRAHRRQKAIAAIKAKRNKRSGKRFVVKKGNKTVRTVKKAPVATKKVKAGIIKKKTTPKKVPKK